MDLSLNLKVLNSERLFIIFDVKKFMEIDESNDLKLLIEKLLSIFNC